MVSESKAVALAMAKYPTAIESVKHELDFIRPFPFAGHVKMEGAFYRKLSLPTDKFRQNRLGYKCVDGQY